MASSTTETPIVVIVGETASGKSAIGMEIAKRYRGEIICADSRTIYRGMDVGTAKPNAEERNEIPHHLLDIVEPGEHFTAADFKQQANQVITDCAGRNALPVMVGGTGLYVDAVLFDYQFGNKADNDCREQLLLHTVEELHQMLVEQHIVAPAGETNKRHLVSALERGAFSDDTDRARMRPDTLIIGLQISRSALRSRIEKRIEIMFRQGLRHEVDELVKKYGWGSEALTGIGYREFEAYYDGKTSMGEVKRKITQNTLQLAKRQRTWFRRNPAIQWTATPEQALSLVADFLGR